jgi:hypothetical protein
MMLFLIFLNFVKVVEIAYTTIIPNLLLYMAMEPHPKGSTTKRLYTNRFAGVNAAVLRLYLIIIILS